MTAVHSLADSVSHSGAAAVARGTTRFFARNDIWLVPEITLPNGRRCDLIGLDPKGAVIIIEIKTARTDLLGDSKWPEYLDYSDRFYWALPPEFEHALVEREVFLPERTGLIVADSYDGELVRAAARHSLAAARRSVLAREVARITMRRLAQNGDPELVSAGYEAGRAG
ncbi:MmcB family DNA repair protein [Alterisphingorhabdus coralli]|uniref:MmcB family DNA repair protein n=1 Tax=Alterisphingorhabdus coralli TaxID=3071408 RepID=A0AA97F8E3_9SPHN|nr:MmcB family DNA repair protein [Parasphingorhabdus sp. SCSIO 66989]WOE75826.1 MmcB family DNA repair protein [Parasphingorhabdus sp. SCSIO 66989]